MDIKTELEKYILYEGGLRAFCRAVGIPKSTLWKSMEKEWPTEPQSDLLPLYYQALIIQKFTSKKIKAKHLCPATYKKINDLKKSKK